MKRSRKWTPSLFFSIPYEVFYYWVHHSLVSVRSLLALSITCRQMHYWVKEVMFGEEETNHFFKSALRRPANQLTKYFRIWMKKSQHDSLEGFIRPFIPQIMGKEGGHPTNVRSCLKCMHVDRNRLHLLYSLDVHLCPSVSRELVLAHQRYHKNVHQPRCYCNEEDGKQLREIYLGEPEEICYWVFSQVLSNASALVHVKSVSEWFLNYLHRNTASVGDDCSVEDSNYLICGSPECTLHITYLPGIWRQFVFKWPVKQNKGELTAYVANLYFDWLFKVSNGGHSAHIMVKYLELYEQVSLDALRYNYNIAAVFFYVYKERIVQFQ